MDLKERKNNKKNTYLNVQRGVIKDNKTEKKANENSSKSPQRGQTKDQKKSKLLPQSLTPKQKKNNLNKTNSKDKGLIKEILEVKNEFLDINLSCDYLFTYIHENNCFDKKYTKRTFFWTYFTLVMTNFTLISFLLNMRPLSFSYKMSCYNSSTSAYEQCTLRNFCFCEDLTKCIIPCYNDILTCLNTFNKVIIPTKSTDLKRSFGEKIFIRFIDYTKNVNILNKLPKIYFCDEKYIITAITISYFIGGFLGHLISGYCSEKYGKKRIITGYLVCLIMNLLVASMVGHTSLNNFENYTMEYIYAWCAVGFIQGFFLLPLKSLIYLLFMENYPNIFNIKFINGVLHSNIAFSILFYMVLINLIEDFQYGTFISCCYFFIFIIIFVLTFQETPRFYSEQKDNLNKKHFFQRILQKTIVEKKLDNGEKEKYYKQIVLFDSTKEVIVKETIVKKEIEIDSDSDEEDSDLDHIHNHQLQIHGSHLARRDRRPLKLNLILNNSGKNEKFNDDKSEVSKVNLLNRSKKNNSISNSNISRSNVENRYKKNSISISGEKRNSKVNNSFSSKNTQNYKSKLERIAMSHRNNFYKEYKKDEYLNKYFKIYFISWFSISFCYYGTILKFLTDVTNPNADDKFRNVGFTLFYLILSYLLPIIIGGISMYVSPSKILIMCLMINSLLSIFWEFDKVYPDTERTLFFGTESQKEDYKQQNYSNSVSMFFIIIAYSLFNLITMTSVPSLYRTLFFMIIKGFGSFSILLTFSAIFLLDCSMLTLGVISLFTCFIFIIVTIRWKEAKLEEFIDTESENRPSSSHHKNKTHKSERKENWLVNDKQRSNSIFGNLISYSMKKQKKY
jgi:MFS family permease